MEKERLSDRNLMVFILLFLLLTYIPFIISRRAAGENFLKGDCYYYRAMTVSMLTDQDLLLANNVAGTDLLNGQLAIGKEGLVPKHPIIMAVASIPLYLLFADAGLLIFNIFNCILLILIIFKLNRLFYSPITSIVTTILYATATLLLDYVYNYSPDIFSSMLLLAGLYYTLSEKFYRGALLLGLSVFAKVTNAPLAGVILLYLFVTNKTPAASSYANDKREFWDNLKITAQVIAVFIVALIPLAYTNYALFGSPFITGYQQIAIADPVTGGTNSISHVNEFNQPLLQGGLRLLFDPLNGILLTNPVIILSFIGVIMFKKYGPKKREKYLILALCLIQFVIFAKYDYWQASSFSNRFLMTSVALSSVFTSNYLAHILEN